MNILFIARSTLFKDKGGDTIQILNTATYLRALGFSVTIRLTNEMIDYSDYDLLHFFNIIRPADILVHVRRSRKPFVISPIFVDYSEFERSQRGGFLGFFANVIPSDTMEFAKAIGRSLINGEKIQSISYLLRGHYGSVRYLAKRAELLLPNSESEYRRFEGHYKTNTDYMVVPNAIDIEVFQDIPATQKSPELLLCVGRIEGRKNQLNLIRAINNTSFKLVIIGSPSANQQYYYKQCRKEARSNIQFIDHLPQSDLLDYYKTAKVHILPSWFETTGLSSLEAAMMRCNIVITDKGDTTEYFGNYAYYCDPSSPLSILTAVEEASRANFNDDLRKKIMNNYTWEHTAEKTREAYLKLKSS